MGQKAAIQRQIDLLRVGPPPTPPQLSPSQQAQSVQIQQQRSDRKTLKRQYRTSRRAANVAARMIQHGLHNAVAELEGQGLQGPELQQAIREFAARQADAVSAARYHQNAAQADFQKADKSLSEDIQTGKTERNAAIDQAEQTYAEDSAKYENKLTVAQLEAEKRSIKSPGGAGGLTPAAARAQTTARKNALIGLKGIFTSRAPVSSTDSTPVRERARQLLAQSRTAFLAAADKQIPGANQQDIAWALNQLQRQVQKATSGNPKALGKVQRGGYGGKTAQAISGGS